MYGEELPVSHLVAVFAKSVDEQAAWLEIHYGPKESRDTFIELASRMLEAWAEFEHPKCRVLAVEHEVRFKVAPDIPEVLGRIDLLEEHEDFVALIDLKSSKSCWNDLSLEEHAGQLLLYKLAIQPLADEIGKPLRLGFEVVTKAARKVEVQRLYLDDTAEQVSRQVEIVSRVVAAIRAGHFYPQKSWACLTCPYKKACEKWPVSTRAELVGEDSEPAVAAATR